MSDLKWAHGPKANIKEPVEGLKEDGWQFSDIPTASNFNWLFREITHELAKTRTELANTRAELAEAKKNIEGLNTRITNLRDSMKDFVLEKHKDLYDQINKTCQYLYHHQDEHRRLRHGMSFWQLPLALDPNYRSVVIENIDG